jgi:hypothetical protein
VCPLLALTAVSKSGTENTTMQTDNTQHENKIGQNQAYSSVTPTCTISCGQISHSFCVVSKDGLSNVS